MDRLLPMLAITSYLGTGQWSGQRFSQDPGGGGDSQPPPPPLPMHQIPSPPPPGSWCQTIGEYRGPPFYNDGLMDW